MLLSRTFSLAGLIAFALLVQLSSAATGSNQRPIIGVLTQPSSSSMRQFGASYIASSYVKYIESAGARVVPVHHDAPLSELQATFNSINGVLFPGGGSNLDNTTLYQAGQYLYDLALQANDRGDYFVVFGHCMGFELLSMITSQNFSILSPVDAENISLPLNFTSQASSSRMFHNAPPSILNILATQPVTMNNHQWSLSPSSFAGNKNLLNFYNVLSLNNDREGVTFVSTMEGQKYPVYGVQWHPEKPQFEWDPNEVINHSPDSILANQYMSTFLVSEARKSNHAYPTAAAESAALIYNYAPVYTALYGSSFEQCYFFDKWGSK